MSTAAEPSGISVYDRLRRSDEQLLRWLAEGSHGHEVAACLGEAEYQLLAPLARQAARATRDPQRRVLLIPGIMGSQLGRVRPAPWPADLLWIDPVDVSAGRLFELQWPDQQPLQVLGTIPSTCFVLKLRLEAAGFDVSIHNYDWRADIATLGAALAAQIRRLPAADVTIVAHSMGGLVARAALGHAGGERMRSVVTLGTPHHGTLAAVQALRATYPTVRRLAALDPQHSAEELTARVFHGFPSLYDLLPEPGALTDIDLFDAANWPQSGPQPGAVQLLAARSASQRVASQRVASQRTSSQHTAGEHPRFHCIAGTSQRTATTLRCVADDFVYEISSDGDGTVPMASATLPGAGSYFEASEHGGLPGSERVARATIELLNDGRTNSLPSVATYSTEPRVSVSDTQLRATYADKVDWRALSNEERGRYLNQLNLAPPLYRAVP